MPQIIKISVFEFLVALQNPDAHVDVRNGEAHLSMGRVFDAKAGIDELRALLMSTSHDLGEAAARLAQDQDYGSSSGPIYDSTRTALAKARRELEGSALASRQWTAPQPYAVWSARPERTETLAVARA